MSYGQLIWDVPNIEGIIKNDSIEKKGKTVESFLKKHGIQYTKKYSQVTIYNNTYTMYGYDVDNGSDPWFNITEAIKNNCPQVFFIIASSYDKWDGKKATRGNQNEKYYYLYKLSKPFNSEKQKITWEELTGKIKRISGPTSDEILFS